MTACSSGKRALARITAGSRRAFAKVEKQAISSTPLGLAGSSQIQFGHLDRLQDFFGMGHQPRPLCGQAYPPADALQERDARLSLQRRKLLRYRR